MSQESINLHVPAGDEIALLEAIHSELTSTEDPFKRRVLNVMLDTMPGLQRSLDRELEAGFTSPEMLDFATSLTHTLLDMIARTLCQDNDRLTRLLKKHVVLVLIRSITEQRQ